MTAGQDALREAARLEAARVYGGVVREGRSLYADLAEATLDAALARCARRVGNLGAAVGDTLATVENAAMHRGKPGSRRPQVQGEDVDRQLVAAVRSGFTNRQAMDEYGVEYATVQAARKRAMAEGAA